MDVKTAKRGQVPKGSKASIEYATVFPEHSGQQPETAPASLDITEAVDGSSAIENGFNEDQAQEIFEAWMLSQPYYARRMLAVLLAEMFRRRYELGQVAAAQEAAVITGWSDQTVRRFRKDFFASRGELNMGKGASNKLRAAPKRVKRIKGVTNKQPKVIGHRKPRKK